MNEEWKTILEASDYEVSNTGKIRNKKNKNSVKTRIVKRFGYVLVNLQVGSKGERRGKVLEFIDWLLKRLSPTLTIYLRLTM